MAVYPDAIVDKFVVDDGHVANPAGSFQVRGVYPSYFVASVCGETCCGDHVAFGVPGTRPLTITAGFLVGDGHYVGGTGVQFGAPHPTYSKIVGGVGSAQSFGTPKLNVARSPGGVTSAQQFGVPTPKATFLRSVGSVSTAQAFGTVTAVRLSSPQTVPVSGRATAQAFGTPTVKTAVTLSVGSVLSVSAFGTVRFAVKAPTGGVPSAQSFGVPSTKTTVSRSVTGLGSAQAFGVPFVSGGTIKPVGGVPSAQLFGTPTVKAVYRIAPAGVGSAQLFGTPTAKSVTVKPVSGIPSAQAFGAVRTATSAPLGGVPSAQRFGVPTVTVVAPLPQTVTVPGVRGSSAYADSIVDQFKVDDGHVVNAESSASYFGTPWVGHLWLLESDCIDFLEPAICGATCGITICGGSNFLEDTFCYGDSAIVNTFTCGQMLAGELGASFLASTSAASIVDQFVVDDGHVVDGELDGCLDSPLPAICDPGTICGTVVCGGASYIAEIDCVGSLFPTICNEFICGQLPVSGPSLNPPITVTRTIDLQPAGCL